MKCIVLLFALSAVCAVSAVPMPQHGMFFYQQAAAHPSGYYRQPVHRMYMQYQQPYRAYAQRRSAVVPSGGISAYVAGNQVAASGSFLKGLLMHAIRTKLNKFSNKPFRGVFAQNIHTGIATSSSSTSSTDDAAELEPETLADDVPVSVENDDQVVSIAEAYPPAAASDEGLNDEPLQDEEEAVPAAVAPVAHDVPVGGKKKNKVTVQLDTEIADDEQAVLGDEVPLYVNRRRPANAGRAPAAAPAPAPASNPINTYFPINFGKTDGSTIAVANAYSTGAKGGARSHAIAYGSGPKQPTRRRKATQAVAVSE